MHGEPSVQLRRSDLRNSNGKTVRPTLFESTYDGLISLLRFASLALISFFEFFEQRAERHFFRFRIDLFEICYPLFEPPLGYFPICGSETVLFAFAVDFFLGIILVVDTVAIQPLNAL